MQLVVSKFVNPYSFKLLFFSIKTYGIIKSFHLVNELRCKWNLSYVMLDDWNLVFRLKLFICLGLRGY